MTFIRLQIVIGLRLLADRLRGVMAVARRAWR